MTRTDWMVRRRGRWSSLPRRLGQQAIGLVLAARGTSSGRLDAARTDTMVIAGLDEAAARRLLAESGRVISPLVAERLVDGTGGNPLALLELPDMLTESQLTGAALLPEPLPWGLSCSGRSVSALAREDWHQAIAATCRRRCHG